MLKPEDLLPLEAYARNRSRLRAEIIAHKKRRTVHIGEHVTLQFEDALLIRYQVQEMLRIERIFEEAGIQGELDAYQPLLPDGHNWKATLLIEYPDADERRRMLSALKGVATRVWAEVQGCERITPVADEDLEREDGEKTSSVHFLRFELGDEACRRLKAGARLAFGVEHPAYQATLDPVAEEVRAALAEDLK